MGSAPGKPHGHGRVRKAHRRPYGEWNAEKQKKKNTVILFAVVSCSAGEAGAARPEQGKWSLGIAGPFSTSPYKAYDNTILPLPLIAYRGERFFGRVKR